MDYKFKTEPYAHQLHALGVSYNKENYALFMEMGTGKSKVLVDNIAMLYDKGKINAALIVERSTVIDTFTRISVRESRSYCFMALQTHLITVEGLFQVSLPSSMLSHRTSAAWALVSVPLIYLLEPGSMTLWSSWTNSI